MTTTRPATPDDVPLILSFIRALADYEHLSHAVVATEDLLRSHLFGPRPAAEVPVGPGAGLLPRGNAFGRS